MQLIVFLKEKMKGYKLRKERKKRGWRRKGKRKNQREREGGKRDRRNRLCRNPCGLLFPHCQDLQPTSAWSRGSEIPGLCNILSR